MNLLVFAGGKRLGFEFKYADAPTVTKSVKAARDDLKLTYVFIVHPGGKSYPLDDGAEAVALWDLKTRVERFL